VEVGTAVVVGYTDEVGLAVAAGDASTRSPDAGGEGDPVQATVASALAIISAMKGRRAFGGVVIAAPAYCEV
jgi:hypothetical protein